MGTPCENSLCGHKAATYTLVADTIQQCAPACDTRARDTFGIRGIHVFYGIISYVMTTEELEHIYAYVRTEYYCILIRTSRM